MKRKNNRLRDRQDRKTDKWMDRWNNRWIDKMTDRLTDRTEIKIHTMLSQGPTTCWYFHSPWRKGTQFAKLLPIVRFTGLFTVFSKMWQDYQNMITLIISVTSLKPYFNYVYILCSRCLTMSLNFKVSHITKNIY